MDIARRWRLLVEDGVSDAAGLAADEALAASAGDPPAPPTLRLYTYRPCVLVGRFQTVPAEIRVERCRARGIPINRRPTGGGAIMMGPDQLGIALVLPGADRDAYARARELMVRFSAGIVAGLARLGVEASFRGKNDIEVGGRKIAGLGIFRHPSGGLLFHASLLVDLDVPLMLDLLHTPFEKITDKEVATVAARTSTVRKEAGAGLPLDGVRDRIAEGYRETFGIELAPGDFTELERACAARLEAEKYRDPQWILQEIDVPDAFGEARRKTPRGLLEVRVTLAGKMLKAVFIGGDFFAAEGAVADLEARLRWHTGRPAAVERTLREAHAARRGELQSLPLEELIETVQTAILQAGRLGAREQLSRYGCFVDPHGA